jgi:hypothetical protein
MDFFNLFHNRRAEILSRPFPPEWRGYLQANVRHYGLLTAGEQCKLEDDLRVFAAEKTWEGAHGFEITDEVRVCISALACLLTLEIPGEPYPNVETVIVYPAAFQAPADRRVAGGIVEETIQGRIGEAHLHGPVVLSWADVLRSAASVEDGRNLVLHEFAHKLDLRDGDANGVPYLRSKAACTDWSRVMSAEFARLKEDVEGGRHTLLDAYGATNPAEFFAVVTEVFFERGRRLRESHPELYCVLQDYYRQDTAQRC